MIFDYFIKLVSFLINALAGFLPTVVLIPDGVSDLILGMVAFAYGFDWLFPVSTVFAIIVTYALIQSLKFSVLLFDAVIGTIRSLR